MSNSFQSECVYCDSRLYTSTVSIVSISIIPQVSSSKWLTI